jgi:hypothetical protein
VQSSVRDVKQRSDYTTIDADCLRRIPEFKSMQCQFRSAWIGASMLGSWRRIPPLRVDAGIRGRNSRPEFAA